MKIQKFIVIYGIMILWGISLSISSQIVRADQRQRDNGAGDSALGFIPAQLKTNDIIVTTTADSMTTDGQCSLREAIYNANTNPGVIILGECTGGVDDKPDRIVLANGATYLLTINNGVFDPPPSIGDLDILNDLPATDLYIAVENNGTAIIDAHIIEDRILDIASGAAVIVTGVTFTGGNSVLNGGAIRNVGNLTLNDSVVLENDADDNGAGIYNDTATATLTLMESQVLSNTVQGTGLGGGGIYNGVGSTLNIQESTISFNYSHEDGGGILNQGDASISNSLFEKDESRAGIGGGIGGGAIHNTGGNAGLFISNTIFRGHRGGAGGAIYNGEDSQTTVEDSLLEGNLVLVGGKGGAIYNEGDFLLRQSDVHHNNAKQGGGIYSAGAASQMRIDGRSNIYENQATVSDGGGIYMSNGELLLLNSSIISNTTAEYGGGIAISNDGTATLANITIGRNSAGLEGGGLAAISTGFAELYNVTLTNNNAPAGAALYKFGTAGISLANSIINGAAGATCAIQAGVLLSNGHNLFRDDTCPLLAVQIGDQFNIDPHLTEIMEQNGTYSYEPLNGSPALNAGDTTTCENPFVNKVDQLGNIRPIGAGCEIGAVETAATVHIFLPIVVK